MLDNMVRVIMRSGGRWLTSDSEFVFTSTVKFLFLIWAWSSPKMDSFFLVPAAVIAWI
jgi:hypothetical protein